MAKASTSGASRVRKKVKKNVSTASRTFTLRSTTPSSPSPTVRAMPCRGRRRVAQASRARASRRRSPAQVAAETAGRVAMEYGIKTLEVRIKGPGPGRESSVRALNALGIKISEHRRHHARSAHGCRPPKRRRI